MTDRRPPRRSSQDYYFVAIQAVLFGAFLYFLVWPTFPAVWPEYLGAAVCLSGLVVILMAVLQLNTTLSPFPTPVANGQLVTTGAFALARHPIYTGVLLAGAGYAIYASSWVHAALTLALWVLFYFKSNYEERLLRTVYPEYEAYRTRVGRFLPFSVLG